MKSNELILLIWREVCQHLELNEAIRRVATLLEQQVRLSALIVRRIDAPRRFLETVATAGCNGCPAPHHDRIELGEVEIRALCAWSVESLSWHRREKAGQGLPNPAVGIDTSLDVVALPLCQTSKPAAVLLFVSDKGTTFTPSDLAILQSLLEPMTVAYENAMRIRELTVLREVTEAENRTLASKLGRTDSPEIVGARWGLRDVLEKVSLVASSDVPVLLLGETGSGKEVIARAIHDQSQRTHGPFLRVNCGAIPSELVDSELFGHEKGSFTGAMAQKKGWFERADQGTLLLDECGELTLAAQVRLLRALQEGTFERVGGEREVNVDVRIIAATHRDLKVMVSEGRFRQDLWYRLAVFPIAIPPLRERKEDIAGMAAQFSLRASSRLGFGNLVPSDEDIDRLLEYSWPGNVRELKAVIERALILGGGRGLRIAQALADSTMQPSGPMANAGTHRSPVRVGGRFETLDEAMRRHIEKALDVARGRIEGRGGAAQLLGINPHTLRGRMRKLKVDWARFRPPDEDFLDPGAGI